MDKDRLDKLIDEIEEDLRQSFETDDPNMKAMIRAEIRCAITTYKEETE
ncbi:hypothetical protein [Bifidobacterium pseudocatenulatum]|nr:hypothetical protein [Bifidobacterium pseudocatenulatum]CUN66826.1 Uncharacterised protein [Bifidobacterium pseudocatenulatum]DAZ63981.1 MAG TPA: hypothetical protein [Caudoviricetes sp.]